MNRYPLWKYLIIAVALIIGVLYTLPNFFGEDPAVQVSAARSTVKVDATTRQRVDQLLSQAGIRSILVRTTEPVPSGLKRLLSSRWKIFSGCW